MRARLKHRPQVHEGHTLQQHGTQSHGSHGPSCMMLRPAFPHAVWPVPTLCGRGTGGRQGPRGVKRTPIQGERAETTWALAHMEHTDPPISSERNASLRLLWTCHVLHGKTELQPHRDGRDRHHDRRMWAPAEPQLRERSWGMKVPCVHSCQRHCSAGSLSS